MSASAKTSEHDITPEQLCIGLHVHLDLSWTEHPFTFSSFKIKSLDQIAIIQGLGLKRIRYSPSKSDAKPLPAAAPATPDKHAETQASDQQAVIYAADPAVKAKHERMHRLAEQRARTNACEQGLLSAANTIKSINKDVFSKPDEVREAANTLITTIADSMLVDADVSVQLMADKVGGEDAYFHSLNVSLLSMMLAKELKAPAAMVQMVGVGALFHDIGELEIPEQILRKQETLNKSELALLKLHGEYGINIAKKMGLPTEVLQVIAQHHERVDGSGYPLGLTAAQMSLPSRIVSLVNAYDELCNPPNPATALTPHEALSTLFAQQRAQFDPLCMSTFVRCMGVYPPGTVVILSNGATAMVVSVNTSKPLRPVVVVYDPAVPKEAAIVVDLDTEQDISITQTIRPQNLAPDAHAYLSPRKRMTYYFDTQPGQPG